MKKKILVSLSSFAIASTPIISVVACQGNEKGEGGVIGQKGNIISKDINFQADENLYIAHNPSFVLTPEMVARHNDIHTYITEEDILNYLLDNNSNNDQIQDLINNYLKNQKNSFTFQIAFKDSTANMDININWRGVKPTVTIDNVQILKGTKDVTMQEGIFRKDLIKTVVRKLMSSLIELKDTLKTNSIDVAAKNTIKEKVKSQTYISGDPKYLIGECVADQNVFDDMIHESNRGIKTNKFLNVILQNPSHLFNEKINILKIAQDIFNALEFYKKLSLSTYNDLNYVVFHNLSQSQSWGFAFSDGDGGPDNNMKSSDNAIKEKINFQFKFMETFNRWFSDFFNHETT